MLVIPGARGLRITAVDEAARKAGLAPGMRLSDARAQVPGLVSEIHGPDRDAAALRRLAHWCGRYTPWVTTDGPDGLWLDVTGCAHLFGGEEGLVGDLVHRLATLGFTTRVGLAGTPGAAWAVARFAGPDRETARACSVVRGPEPASGPASRDGERLPSHGVIVEPGRLMQALAPLPVAGLRLSDEALTLLRRLGLATIGRLADVPRTGLACRFRGEMLPNRVLSRLDQALGLVDEPLSPLAPVPQYRLRHDFAEPLLTTEAILAVLDRLLAALSRLLERDGKGALRMTFSLYRTDGSVAATTVGLSRPSREPAHLARLFRDRLETVDAGYGVDVVVLGAPEVADLRPRQTSLASMAAAGQDADTVRLADRLMNRFGSTAVTRPEPRPSHVPERAQMMVPAGSHGGDAAGTAIAADARPLLLLQPPEPARVIAEVPEGPPIAFTGRRVTRRVVRARGPERIAPEWWRDPAGDARPRDYYAVEDEAGRRYWLYREGFYDEAAAPRWFVHGLFA